MTPVASGMGHSGPIRSETRVHIITGMVTMKPSHRRQLPARKTLPVHLMLILALTLLGSSPGVSQDPQQFIWIPSWQIHMGSGTNGNWGNMPVQAIYDYAEAGDQYSMFASNIASDGSAMIYNNMVSSRRQPFNDAMAAKGKPVYLCLGGAGTINNLRSACSDANRARTVSTLTAAIVDDHYAGIDIDWEPLSRSDMPDIIATVTALYQEFQKHTAYYDPSKKLSIVFTMSPGGSSSWGTDFAPIEPYIDIMNLMSYDKMGTWTVVSYYDCAVTARDSNGNLVPGQGVGSNRNLEPATMERQGNQMGIFPKSKINLGIDVMGARMSGVTAPWQTIPSGTSINADYKFFTFYNDVLSGRESSVQFDPVAGAYWMTYAGNFYSFMGAPGMNRSLIATRDFAAKKGYRGFCFWDLTEAYVPGLPTADERNWAGAQLVALRSANPPPPVDNTPPAVTITSPAEGDTLYGSVTVLVDASDASGVSGVRLSIDGVDAGAMTGGSSSSWQFTWNSSSVADGGHTLTAVAADSAGLTSVSSRTVFVKNTLPPPPPAPADSVPPGVSLTAPAEGDTVSGSVTVLADASDASGVSGVRLSVDGVDAGAMTGGSSSSWQFTWNSSSVADGGHTLTAVAADSAGLTSVSSRTVFVRNTLSPPAPPVGGGSSTQMIFDEALQSPWIDASWSSTNSFTSTERVYAGATAIRTDQQSWGALSVHSGEWGQPVDMTSAPGELLQFAVFPEAAGLSIMVSLNNDDGGSFTSVTVSGLSAGAWSLVSIPVSDLNPDQAVVHRITIQNATSSQALYHVDRFAFVSSNASGTLLQAPVLSAPADGSTGLEGDITLEWTPVTGAVSYSVQVARDSLFTQLAVYDTGLTSTVYPLGSLEAGVTWYWRVRTASTEGAGPFSGSYSFTSGASTQPLKYDRLFVDFGKVALGSEKTDSVVLSNEGSADLQIVEVRTSSDNFTTSLPDASVPGHASRKLYIKYKPKKRGTDSDLIVSIVDSMNNVDTVRVTGRGANPPSSRHGRNSIAVGDVPTETVITDSFYIANDGDLDLIISSVTTTSADVEVSPETATVPAGDSVRFALLVKPRTMGEFNEYVIFAYGDEVPGDSLLIEGTVMSGGMTGTPGTYALGQNYPNPFNPTTTIPFRVPYDSRVSVKVYNVFGQEVATLADGVRQAGEWVVAWNATSDAGQPLATGVYYYRIEAVSLSGTDGEFTNTRRMVLLK